MKTAKLPDSLDRNEGERTPGKWEVLSVDHDNNRAYIGIDRGYPRTVCVAEVRAETIMHDELEANANLIAAAPDLLAACEDIAESLHVAGYDFSRKTGRQLLKAIAKAKGTNAN